MNERNDISTKAVLPYEDVSIVEELPGNAGAHIRFVAFNTMVDCMVYATPEKARAILEKAQEDCRTYERLFSRTLASSDIGRLNAAEGEAVRIDPRTADVLQAALGYCEASEGVFDITVAPLVQLWDFRQGVEPTAEELAEAVDHVGWRKLDIWAQCGGNWFAQLRDPQAAVDLGGIAKGWIADALGKMMLRYGATGAMINLGGNVLVVGEKPNGAPWRVGIREPKPTAEAPKSLHTVELERGSMVTSGTYERAFEKDGTLHHHILDPRTGMPVASPWASVSVVADRSLDAEGFSTTLLVLGLERSRELAKSHPEILQSYFTSPEGDIELLHP